MSNLKKIKVNNFILNNIILGIFILILAYNLKNILNIFTPKIIEGNTDYSTSLSTIFNSHQTQATQIALLNADVTALQQQIASIQQQLQAQGQANAQNTLNMIS